MRENQRRPAESQPVCIPEKAIGVGPFLALFNFLVEVAGQHDIIASGLLPPTFQTGDS
jgi:hypothetical protein